MLVISYRFYKTFNKFCDFIFNWNDTTCNKLHPYQRSPYDTVYSDIRHFYYVPQYTLIHTDHSFNLQFETLLPNLTNACSVLDYSNADWVGLSSVTVFNLLTLSLSGIYTIKNKIYDAIDLFIPKLNRRAH